MGWGLGKRTKRWAWKSKHDGSRCWSPTRRVRDCPARRVRASSYPLSSKTPTEEIAEEKSKSHNNVAVLETRDREAPPRRRRRGRCPFLQFPFWVREHWAAEAKAARVPVPHRHSLPGRDSRHYHRSRRNGQRQNHPNSSGLLLFSETQDFFFIPFNNPSGALVLFVSFEFRISIELMNWSEFKVFMICLLELQYLKEAGWADGGRVIACTQPRRLAVQVIHWF